MDKDTILDTYIDETIALLEYYSNDLHKYQEFKFLDKKQKVKDILKSIELECIEITRHIDDLQ